MSKHIWLIFQRWCGRNKNGWRWVFFSILVTAEIFDIHFFQKWGLDIGYIWFTVLVKRVWYFVLLNYSCKSWSIFKTRDRFGICWSWGFQNTPYMFNLTKFWLRYLRLKTHETILLFSCYLIFWRWRKQKSEQFVLKSID